MAPPVACLLSLITYLAGFVKLSLTVNSPNPDDLDDTGPTAAHSGSLDWPHSR